MKSIVGFAVKPLRQNLKIKDIAQNVLKFKNEKSSRATTQKVSVSVTLLRSGMLFAIRLLMSQAQASNISMP